MMIKLDNKLSRFNFWIIIFWFSVGLSKRQPHGKPFQDFTKMNPTERKCKMLYFHFDGCSPCTRMDNTTFLNDTVLTALHLNYRPYSVYNFGIEEKRMREKYNVVSNPAYIFLDSSGVESHRMVGYFNSKDFRNEILISKSTFSLSSWQKKYFTHSKDKVFYSKYLIQLEKAGLLDSCYIIEFLSLLNVSDLNNPTYFRDVLQYGYFHASVHIPWGSELYNQIKNLYPAIRDSCLQEYTRTRLIFSANDYLYKTNNPIIKDQIIKELSTYESNRRILLRDMNTNNIHSAMVTKYPSIYYELVQAKKSNSVDEEKSILNTLIKRSWDDHEALNQISWDVFLDQYKFLKAKDGLEIIRRSLVLNRNYQNLDTYANLLYASGNYTEALEIANEAIEHATKHNYNTTDTLMLIESLKAKTK